MQNKMWHYNLIFLIIYGFLKQNAGPPTKHISGRRLLPITLLNDTTERNIIFIWSEQYYFGDPY